MQRPCQGTRARTRHAHPSAVYLTPPTPPPPPPCPAHQVKVCDSALTSFAVQDNGAVVALGTSDGSAHVLRLSAGLAEAVQNEKQGINAMLERETLRRVGMEAFFAPSGRRVPCCVGGGLPPRGDARARAGGEASPVTSTRAPAMGWNW